MSLGDDLILIFSRRSLGWKLHELNRLEYRRVNPTRSPPSRAVLQVTLSRLKKQGLVINDRGGWHLTQDGRAYSANLMNFHPVHSRAANPERRMIVVFDIPEVQRRKRDWLRIELVGLGFQLLQKSVWIGPAPLPQTFVEILFKADLLEHMRFFHAHETEVA